MLHLSVRGVKGSINFVQMTFKDRDEIASLRATIFRHLDGLATAPAAYVLREKGVLDYLLDKGEVTIADVSTAFRANEGYMNVALRLLCSQGWLDCEVDNLKNDVL